MDKKLKDLTVCVFDTGAFVPIAQKLTEEFGRVLYFSPWEGNGFPESKFYRVGTGIKGVTRIQSIWDYVDTDEVDLYVFTDCYYRAEQEYLKRLGKNVWGSGKTSWLERQKLDFYNWIDKNKMPIPETTGVVGLEELAKTIKPDEFIKIEEFRGDLETLKFYDKNRSEFRLKELELALSPFDKEYLTIRQKKIEGIEIGDDSYTVDGEFPKNVMWGVEKKDSSYFCKISPFASLPEQIQYVDNKLSEVFKAQKTCSHFSTEMRIDKSREPFFTDLTCYDDKTEILTDKGWKYFKDLTTEEKVVTLNPENYNIEYYLPLAYQQYDYEGEMISLQSRKKTIDLLITPKHNVWARKRNKGKLISFKANELKGRLTIPRIGKWHHERVEYFVLPSYNKKWNSGKNNLISRKYVANAKKIDMDDWLEFMGYYLSEGSLNGGNCVYISQTKHRNEMFKNLQKLPFKIDIVKNGFQISSKQLYSYLQQFGLCNEKFVPQYIKELSSFQIKIFIDAYGLGDGSFRDTGWKIFTTSKRIANDFQELFMKVGTVANIEYRNAKGTSTGKFPNGKSYIRNHDLYIVREVSKRKDCYLEGITNKRNATIGAGAFVTKKYYKGKIYDITVQNHIIYVRRNGIPCWSGNCRFPNPPYQLHLALVKNLGEIMYYGAQGKMIEPEYEAKYGVVAIFGSETAEEFNLPIKVPDKIKKYVMVMNLAMLDDEYVAMNINKISECGAVVGIGDTIWEARDHCEANSKLIEADGLTIEMPSEQDIRDRIKELKEYGINF